MLAVVATFSRFVFGHLFFYCHVGYWFFSSGNINYVWLFCFSSVTLALCLFYSPPVTIFLSILALLLQSQWSSPLLVFTSWFTWINLFLIALLAELFSLPFLLTFYSLSRFSCRLIAFEVVQSRPPSPPFRFKGSFFFFFFYIFLSNALCTVSLYFCLKQIEKCNLEKLHQLC